MNILRLVVHVLLSISLLSQNKTSVVSFSNTPDIMRKFNKIHESQLGKSPLRRKVVSGFRVPRTVRKPLAMEMESQTLEKIFKNSDVWVFILGLFPFAWATLEFWRRIMFGEAFGTGSDQVVIGMDDSPSNSRGRRILGRGALVTAYVLFAASFATLALVLYAISSSPSPPDTLPAVPDISGQPGLDTILGNS